MNWYTAVIGCVRSTYVPPTANDQTPCLASKVSAPPIRACEKVSRVVMLTFAGGNALPNETVPPNVGAVAKGASLNRQRSPSLVDPRAGWARARALVKSSLHAMQITLARW